MLDLQPGSGETPGALCSLNIAKPTWLLQAQTLNGGARGTHCARGVILAAPSSVAMVPALQRNVLAPSLFFLVEAVGPS